MALLTGSLLCIAPSWVQSESAHAPDSDLAPWERVQVVTAAKSTAERSEQVSVTYNNISRVILYVSSFCRECEQVSEFLKRNRVDFDEEFVLPDARSLLGLTREIATPTTKIIYRDGTSRKVIGFDEKILGTIFEKEQTISDDDSFDISGSGSEFELNQ